MSEMKDLLKKQYKCGKPQKPKPAPKPSSKGKPRGGRGK